MPKLFIGIPIPPTLAQELKTYQQAQSQDSSIRWTREQNFHITLYFMAVVPEEMMGNLHGLLYLFTKECAPFELSFGKYILAPPGKPARMIWARYQKEEVFTQMHHRIHDIFQQIQVNLQLRKSPIPHITLARLKDVDESLALTPYPPPIHATIKVNELVLWESISEGNGVKYEPRHRYDLKG